MADGVEEEVRRKEEWWARVSRGTMGMELWKAVSCLVGLPSYHRNAAVTCLDFKMGNKPPPQEAIAMLDSSPESSKSPKNLLLESRAEQNDGHFLRNRIP